MNNLDSKKCTDCGEIYQANYIMCPTDACKRLRRRKGPLCDLVQAFGVPRGRGRCYESAERVDDHAGQDVFIVGKNGTGKTHAMVGISYVEATAYLMRDDSALGAGWWKDRFKWIDCASIFQQLRESFREKSGLSERDIIRDLVAVDCLFIDDMFAENVTAYTLASLCQILRQREQADRRTVITSNLSVAEIADADPRIGSLLNGYTVVTMKGNDRRKGRNQ